jgi:hypothetical protein
MKYQAARQSARGGVMVTRGGSRDVRSSRTPWRLTAFGGTNA